MYNSVSVRVRFLEQCEYERAKEDASVREYEKESERIETIRKNIKF